MSHMVEVVVEILRGIGEFIVENFIALATLLLAMAAFYSIYLAYYVRPKLEIDFDQREPFCRFAFIPADLNYLVGKYGKKWTNDLKKYLDKNGIKYDPQKPPVPGYWVRVKVKNTGRKSAHQCVGKLAEVSDTNGVRTDFDISALHWVGHFEIDNYHRVFSGANQIYSISKSNKFEPINLGLDDHQYLDILWTEFGGDFFHINCPRYPERGIKYDYEPGIYWLKIIVTADNAESAEVMLEVEWKGIWDQIIVTKIDG